MREVGRAQAIPEPRIAGEADDRVRILYVTGFGRSGSTLLGNLLGSVPGFVAVGEVVQLWTKILIPGWLCGCGRTLVECPIWGETLARLGLAPQAPEVRRMASEILRAIRSHHLPLFFTERGRARLAPTSLRTGLGQLYRTLADVAGADVLVDTSKLPSYGRALDVVDALDVRVLHVVRDPRAVAFSWRRNKRHRTAAGSGAGPTETDKALEVARFGAARSVFAWTLANLETEILWRGARADRYLMIRYEDFVREPAEALRRIVAFVGAPSEGLPIKGRRARMTANHAVAGNPNRHAGSEVEIREDVEWLAQMPPSRRALVTTMTTPLRARYGYARSVGP